MRCEIFDLTALCQIEQVDDVDKFVIAPGSLIGPLFVSNAGVFIPGFDNRGGEASSSEGLILAIS